MASVNKAELVNEIAAKTSMKKKDAEAVLASTLESIQSELVNGNKVQLIGFGTFEVRHRAARKGRNPQTGKEITIAATEVPAFKPGKALKDAINK